MQNPCETIMGHCCVLEGYNDINEFWIKNRSIINFIKKKRLNILFAKQYIFKNNQDIIIFENKYKIGMHKRLSTIDTYNLNMFV